METITKNSTKFLQGLQVRKITSSGSLPNAEPFLKQASGTVDKGDPESIYSFSETSSHKVVLIQHESEEFFLAQFCSPIIS